MKKLLGSVKERVTKRVERRAEEESPSPGKVKETETIEAGEKTEPEVGKGKKDEESVKEERKERMESAEGEEGKETEGKRLKKPSLKERLKRVIKREVTITEKDVKDILEEFELNLISNDVAVEVAESIRKEMERELIGRKVKGKSEIPKVVERSLQRALLSVLEPEREVDLFKVIEEAREEGRPAVIMFVGVNGSGKTTTIAKVAKLLKDRGYSVVIAAADTFRAAAIEQLEEHAERLGVTLIKGEKGDDPAAVAFNAVQHAEAKGKDVVLVDTAGRAYTDVNLMEELRKMKRVLEPDLVIFVGDALAGNDAVEQARTFDEYVGIDGAILTKVDADAKGGAVLSITKVTGAPILYLGVGQGYDDLKEFQPEWFVERVVGAESS